MRLGSVGQLNSGAAMPISTCLKNTSKSYRYGWTWVLTSPACGRTRYCSMPRPDHNIEKCYNTFIRQVSGPSKNSTELFFNAKFDFKSTWNRDSTTSHHKHPVCQSPAGDAEKLTNVWSRYFGTNRIIDNWHRCLGVMWRQRKNYFDK